MIIRKLGDHTDSTTYYVRAVVRNSISGAIITTINLTNAGDRRFYKLYEVPADVSGQGFYIDIETSVYSDSGYTTKASGYSDELEQYLVFNRVNSGGGGGGVDVDYPKIQKMLNTAIKSIPEVKIESLEPLKKTLEAIKTEIEAIEMPEMEKMDHTPVLKAIADTQKTIIKAIDDKEVTPKTDLSELETNILTKIEDKEPNLEEVMEKMEEIKQIISDFIADDQTREGAKEKLFEIKKALSPIFENELLSKAPKNDGKKERINKLL